MPISSNVQCSDHMHTARAGETQACADAAAERIAALEEAAEATAEEHEGALAEAEVLHRRCSSRCCNRSVPLRVPLPGCKEGISDSRICI